MMLMRVFFVVVFLLLPGWAQSQSAEQKSAEAAATEIMNMFGSKNFQAIYNQKTSAFFKKFVHEGQFLANVTMGRAQLGSMTSSKIVDVQLSNYDPATKFKGVIYAVNFDNSYGGMRFFERIVVIKEADGAFRMSGFWGVPAAP